MPKLVQFNAVANWGSTGRIAEDIGEVARADGWESYVAYGRQCNPSRTSNLLRIGGKASVLVHMFLARFLDRDGFGSYFATKRLLKQLDEIKPDLFQFHNLHGSYINLPLVLKYARKKDIPVVLMLHDCWSMTGHCPHFVKAGCEKWKTGCGKCPLKKEYPQSWLLDSSKRNYREKKKLLEAVPRLSIIAGSSWLASIVSESYLKEREVHQIPYGIDTEIFQPRSGGADIRKRLGIEGKFVILAAGTYWGEDKGLYDYGKLRKLLSDEYAIVLVGLAPEQIPSLPEGIIGLTRTNTPEELSEYYSMADCVMSLSRMESAPLTPIEANTCGTPIIVYETTGLTESVTPETGFLAKFLDVEDVKEKVEAMREKGKSFYTARCRELAVEKFDRKKCYARFIQVYNDMIKK